MFFVFAVFLVSILCDLLEVRKFVSISACSELSKMKLVHGLRLGIHPNLRTQTAQIPVRLF